MAVAKINFSEEQLAAINLRGSNLLLSAAAGSGKTAVLVNRVIEKITDKDNPTDIDKILVLTFTNAAAAQMKNKISNAIAEKLREEPDENLERQAMLVHNAQITTIHSFCLYLIRNNFSNLGIDPGFRIAEEGERILLESDVMDELLEKCFADEEGSAYLLADRFASKNNISNLKDTLLSLYKNISNNAFVEDYLEYMRNLYNINTREELEESQWFKELMTDAHKSLESLHALAMKNLELAKGPDGAYGYIENIEDDERILSEALEQKDYESLYRYFATAKFGDLSRKKMVDVSEESKNECKDIRKAYKEGFNALGSDSFSYSVEHILASFKENKKVMNALADVLLQFSKELWNEKQKRKILDFSDMEHLALKLLYTKEGDTYVTTKTAHEYRECFEEVMVDEYQDSNDIQELILDAISKNEDGIYNRFMVGDVKQSIYSFRNACPDLFMEKYLKYSYDESECMKIDLSNNFRSRNEVIDTVNYVFERIMRKDTGGIDYDEHARLYAKAAFPESDGNESELIITDVNGLKGLDVRKEEAKTVAATIKELVGKKKITDPDTNELRTCMYKDIVILLRTNNGWDDIFKKTLDEYGIPAYVTSKNGYFSASEVAMVLNMLSALDNPLNDIPFFGCMTGAFGGFDDNEAAALRTLCQDKLWKAVKKVATKEIDTEDILRKKCLDLYTFIEEYRDKIVYTPIHLLLMEIFEKKDYLAYVSSLPYGDQRKANVLMLLEKAKAFESGSYKGLHHFIRYIERCKTYDVDFGEAITASENSDVVRIMSIHKSKGLEFPVCILAGMSKQFNYKDSVKDVLYNRKYGVAFDYVDVERMLKYKCIRKKYVSMKIKEDILAEEMRVLYVAMTRAKDKLIMSSTSNNLEKTYEKNKRDLPGYKEPIDYSVIKDYKSYLDMMLSVFDLTKNNKNIIIKEVSSKELEEKDINERVAEEKKKSEIKDIIKENSGVIKKSTEELINRISFDYPYSNLENLYTKVSVSELKMKAIHSQLPEGNMEEKPKEIFDTEEKTEYIPAFIKEEEKKITGSMRGSATHRIMELWHFTDDDWIGQEVNVKDKISELVKEGFLNQDEADMVNPSKIMTFVSTNLALKMSKAAKQNMLYLEQPFVLGIDATRLDENFSDDEIVLIQGIIDAFYIEEGKITLMDYKTDAVDEPKALAERYKTQLDYYSEALERITGLKVESRLIYSFRQDRVIDIDNC